MSPCDIAWRTTTIHPQAVTFPEPLQVDHTASVLVRTDRARPPALVCRRVGLRELSGGRMTLNGNFEFGGLGPELLDLILGLWLHVIQPVLHLRHRAVQI